MRQNKKRDRSGETYGQYTIIGPTGKDKEWIARCSCGRERTVKNDNIWKLNSCKSCAAKLRIAKQKDQPKKDKFRQMQSWMSPKKPLFKLGIIYKLNYPSCKHPCFGTLINEYGKSASFEIIDCHVEDKAVLSSLNNKISLRKKLIVENG